MQINYHVTVADMRRTVDLLARTLANQELVSDTGRDVLRRIETAGKQI